jgi:hypothetical protein
LFPGLSPAPVSGSVDRVWEESLSVSVAEEECRSGQKLARAGLVSEGSPWGRAAADTLTHRDAHPSVSASCKTRDSLQACVLQAC